MQLQLENLTYTYGKGTAFEKVAVDNVNVNIQGSEFLAIIGHTGSGKSTLIQHFNGLLKPTEGRVLYNGIDVFKSTKNLEILRKEVGLVFQYPEQQLFETTVFKDVAFGPKNLNLDEDEINIRVKKALTLVGISEELFDKSPFELSGGQKRRVAIAGVLAMEPKVLVLDEPAAGLDPRGRDDILNKIKEMRKELNIAIVLVSHSMEDVAKLAERIIVISQGKIVKEGTPEDVFYDIKFLENIGLAAPQISYLIHELKNKGFDIPLNIYTVDEATKVLYKILKQV